MASCNRVRHLLCGGSFQIPLQNPKAAGPTKKPSNLPWLEKHPQPDPTEFTSIADGPRNLMKVTGFADNFFGLSALAPGAMFFNNKGASFPISTSNIYS
jgi:hypothetical protein